MFRVVMLALLAAGSIASAQNIQPMPGGRPAGQTEPKRPPLKDEARAHYILAQIELSAEQKANAEGLLESSFAQAAAAGSGATIDLSKVQSLMEELRQAQADGNKQREEQITEELRSMGRGGPGTANAEREFLDNLRKSLNPEQLKQLDEALSRLERNPSGALRPIDVIRAAQAMNLSKQEEAELERAAAVYRKQVNGTVMQLGPEGPRGQSLTEMIEAIKKTLGAERGGKFEARVNRMRPLGGEKRAGETANP